MRAKHREFSFSKKPDDFELFTLLALIEKTVESCLTLNDETNSVNYLSETSATKSTTQKLQEAEIFAKVKLTERV